jgi:hypothetical protein
MIGVIKGDIVDSRNIQSPESWLDPLKEQLGKWGSTPQDWELVWGDFFQLEIPDPNEALLRAFTLKSLLKGISTSNSHKAIGHIDVRMAIGIGTKDYSGSRISESNGSAFVLAGEKFDKLKKDKSTLGLNSPWPEFNDEMNLLLKLSLKQFDHWSVSSARLVKMVLDYPQATQADLGKILGIKQNSVSGRWERAHLDDLFELDSVFRKKIKTLLP